MPLQNEQSLLLRGVLQTLPVSTVNQWLLTCTFVPYRVSSVWYSIKIPFHTEFSLKRHICVQFSETFYSIKPVHFDFFFHKGKTGEMKCSLSLSLLHCC